MKKIIIILAVILISIFGLVKFIPRETTVTVTPGEGFLSIQIGN